MARITLIDKAISAYERKLTEATFTAFFPNDFNYNESGKGIVNNLKVVLPIKLTSKSAQTYTFKVVLFQGLKTGSGWQDNQSSDGKIRSYWRGSSDYPFNEANYKSICGTILAETSLTFVAEEATSISRWWSFTLSNFQIDANRFYNNKRIDIGLIQTSGDAISYNDKTSPSSEINESYSWTSDVAVVPSGTFSNISIQALDSTSATLDSSYAPVAGKHKLKVSWSYSDSSVSGYEVNLIKGKDELPLYSSKTSSTSTIFNIPSKGDYYLIIQPYTLVGTDYLLGAATLSPHIKFYDLKFIYGEAQKFSFTDSDGNVITSSTSSSTINVNWASDTFIIKKVNEANQESSSGYTPTYLTFSYKINGIDTSTKVNYNAGSLSVSNLASNSTFELISVKASVSEPRSSTITLAESVAESIKKTISTITAASITNLNLVNIKYATHSNTGDQKVISATANVNFTNFPSGNKTFRFTFGGKTLSYFTTDTNGIATIELGEDLQNISFSSYSVKVLSGGTTLTFNYNDRLVSSAVYNHNSTLSFLDNWGISPSVNLDGDLNFNSSNYMLNYLQLILNNYYIPSDVNLLNITADVTQGSKTLSWLNRSLTSNLDLTLRRESLEDFIYDQPITVTIKITSSVFPVDASNSSLSIQKSFKITTSCSYNGLTISGGNIIQKYNLTQWKDLGESACQSASLNPSFTIPNAFIDGGTTKYAISLDESGILDLDNDELTVTTNSSTPIRSITITLNIRYTQNGKLIYNGSRSTTLIVRDERVPYIPDISLAFENLDTDKNSYFLPNYSKLKINDLGKIDFPSELNKKISFYLLMRDAEGIITQKSAIQEIALNNLANVYFDINKIYPSLFTQNNEASFLGIKITASCDNRSNSKNIISQKHPAYIEQPQLISIEAISTEKASQVKIAGSLSVGCLKDKLEYKATATLTNTINSISESQTSGITYGNEKNIIIPFSNPLPDYGTASSFIEILYNGERLFISQTKITGFSKDIGEIAVRKGKVGFHGAPTANSVFSIYAVAGSEGDYLLSFHNGGEELGGFKMKNGTDIVFSAGKWE